MGKPVSGRGEEATPGVHAAGLGLRSKPRPLDPFSVVQAKKEGAGTQTRSSGLVVECLPLQVVEPHRGRVITLSGREMQNAAAGGA